MGIMKNWILALSFATTLAAQQVPDPRVELANVIAVEEQERDLAKAEQLYRDALAGSGLSAGGRAFANLRLGNLLRRLGRGEEAKPFLEVAAKARPATGGDTPLAQGKQDDAGRQQALRVKARELVQQVVEANDTQGKHDNALLFGIEQSTAEQLLWLGEAAVPEVIAALDAMRTTEQYNPGVGTSLGALLWRIGGAKAEAFLREARRDERLRFLIARSASSLRAPQMLDVAAAYLRDDDPELAMTVLESHLWGQRIGDRMPVAVLLDTMRRDARRQQWLLRWNTTQPLDPDTMTQLLPIVQKALQSTEPELGAAAQRFLLFSAVQSSPELLGQLLDWLPALLANGQQPAVATYAPATRQAGARKWQGRFDEAGARPLLPKLVACVQKIGPAAAQSEPTRRWLEALMDEVTMPLPEDAMPLLLAWLDLGYAPMHAVLEFLTADNAAEVMRRFDVLDGTQQQWLLAALGNIDLPRELFEPLRLRAERAGAPAREFGLAIARTGDVEAAAWILAQWQANLNTSRARDLLSLLARNDTEPARAAIRAAIVLPRVQDRDRAAMLLSLLAKGDQPALDLVAQWPMVDGSNPLPTGGPNLTPLQFLLYADLEPKQPFTDSQVTGVLAAIADRRSETNPRRFSMGAIPDRWLAAMADLFGPVEWQDAAFRRLIEREFHGPLATWFEAKLRPDAEVTSLGNPPRQVVDHYRAQIEVLLDSDSESRAANAALCLCRRAGPPSQPLLDRLLQNRHEAVRQDVAILVSEGRKVSLSAVRPLLHDASPVTQAHAAQIVGAAVDKDSVPDLLELLRDADSGVRHAAAEALQRIRFYHEQQAHWDRVLHGLDASPAAAAEKLLLQAKPDAPREQRLLAMRSLGRLGQPEALPFLIDWTSDGDAEIAAAAKAAVTEIHLHPRR